MYLFKNRIFRSIGLIADINVCSPRSLFVYSGISFLYCSCQFELKLHAQFTPYFLSIFQNSSALRDAVQRSCHICSQVENYGTKEMPVINNFLCFAYFLGNNGHHCNKWKQFPSDL